jgi:hypothetical protein
MAKTSMRPSLTEVAAGWLLKVPPRLDQSPAQRGSAWAWRYQRALSDPMTKRKKEESEGSLATARVWGQMVPLQAVADEAASAAKEVGVPKTLAAVPVGEEPDEGDPGELGGC